MGSPRVFPSRFASAVPASHHLQTQPKMATTVPYVATQQPRESAHLIRPPLDAQRPIDLMTAKPNEKQTE